MLHQRGYLQIGTCFSALLFLKLRILKNELRLRISQFRSSLEPCKLKASPSDVHVWKVFVSLGNLFYKLIEVKHCLLCSLLFFNWCTLKKHKFAIEFCHSTFMVMSTQSPHQQQWRHCCIGI